MFQLNYQGLKTIPFLWGDSSVKVFPPENDLYVCDLESWCRLSELVRLLRKEKWVRPYSGISTGCVLLYNHECRYEWTLHEPLLPTGAGDQSLECGGFQKFQWFLLLHKHRQVLEAFVACQTLFLGNVDCLLVRDRSECSSSSPGHIKFNMVVKAARDLEFYSSRCAHLPFNEIVASLQRGNDVYRTPNFSEFPLKIVPIGEIPYFSEMKCTMETAFPLDRVVKCEEICYSNSITALVVNDAHVDEPDMQWLKTESDGAHFEEQGKQRDFQHASHLIQETPNATGRKKCLSFGKLMEIAKRYADLNHRGNRNLASFPCKLSGPIVLIECPICNIPAKCSSSSAFLMMLRHVSRRHLHSRSAAFDYICDHYAPFILYMKQKIAVRAQKQYLKKLRRH